MGIGEVVPQAVNTGHDVAEVGAVGQIGTAREILRPIRSHPAADHGRGVYQGLLYDAP